MVHPDEPSNPGENTPPEHTAPRAEPQREKEKHIKIEYHTKKYAG